MIGFMPLGELIGALVVSVPDRASSFADGLSLRWVSLVVCIAGCRFCLLIQSLTTLLVALSLQ